jgi:hypothetical protein
VKPSLRWLWPVLLIGSIVYAAGPNGAWMARQFTAPVPPAWGWFGAVLLGLAVFGGIKLAVAGQRIGLAIALVGGVCAIVIDSQYFASAGHGIVMAALLGLFPTLLAALAGVVEGVDATRAEAQAEAEAQARLAWELREASKDRAAARRLQAGRPPERTPDTDTVTGHADRPLFDDATRRAALAYLGEFAGDVSATDLAQRFGVSERTGRRYLAAYRRNGHTTEVR